MGSYWWRNGGPGSAKMAFRRLASSSKPFYVSTPIFYVNASPHLGHLYSMLLCDTRIRWEKLQPGQRAFFLTGTDEHGLKIQAAAELQNLQPKELVDKVSLNFKSLAQKLNINYDRFMRTTDLDHIETVKYFWDIVQRKGLIHEGLHSGWYSVSDETFYPETQVEEVKDPKSGKLKMISKETKNEVIYNEETNYFFKLLAFQDRLIGFLEKNPDFIRPKTKYDELLAELKEGPLPDLSVSRPSSRLKWGIEVPNDPSQKIYVWFDALLNYITACRFSQDFKADVNGVFSTPETNPWPATHVIGKDIIRFHCIYWPIFLMAANVELPKQVIVHSHWLCDGFKMSKSLGNIVDPVATYEHYGEDAVRLFLTEYSNIEADCNYSEKAFHFTRENLIGKYANLMTRCGGASFDIERSVRFNNEGRYLNIDELISTHIISPDKATEADEIRALRDDLVAGLNALYEKMDARISVFDHMKAIQEWWIVVERANQFVQKSQPWVYNKVKKDPNVLEEEKECYATLQNYFIYLASESVRISSILISPVIPRLSGQVLDRLLVPETDRNSTTCLVGGQAVYGHNANSKTHKIPIERVPMRTSL